MTTYLVLYKPIQQANSASTAQGWAERARVEASSADAAIRQYVEKASDQGQYVAVPARSWTPRTVKVETTKRIELS